MTHLHPVAGGSTGTLAWVVGGGAVALDPDGPALTLLLVGGRPALTLFVRSLDVLLGLDSHSSTSTFALN